MIKNIYELGKSAFSYGQNSYKKKGALTVETVIIFALLILFLAVMAWVIYFYIKRRMIDQNIGGVVDEVDAKKESIFDKIFGDD